MRLAAVVRTKWRCRAVLVASSSAKTWQPWRYNWKCCQLSSAAWAIASRLRRRLCIHPIAHHNVVNR